MSYDRTRIHRYFVSATLLSSSLLCFAYAAVAYQNARAAAAMPFAIGGFDERHVWIPVGLAIAFLFAAIATVWNR